MVVNALGLDLRSCAFCWDRGPLSQSSVGYRPHTGNFAGASAETTVKKNLTIPEYCAAYGVGRSTAYALIAAGDLIRIKVGRRTLIPVESAEAHRATLLEAAGATLPETAA